jgi:alkylation response protein AidB-like acyl-CoA dehydrogenase
MISVDELRARAAKWLAEVAPPELSDDYDERYAQLRRWHRILYDAGWVGLQWPAEYGGRGLTVEHQLAFTTELVRARAPQPVGSIGLEVVGPTILRHGTEAQRARFVRTLLSGEEIWCQGFSEPEAGSDLASLRTKGVFDGDELVITGQKVWTSWATHADWCAVLVRTNPEAVRHKGISYVLVDMRTPGITVQPIVQLTGDAEFAELFFDEARVPVDNILGQVDGGWALAMDTLGHERAGYAIRRRLENEISFGQIVDAMRAGRLARDDEQATRGIGELFVALKAFAALSQATARRLLDGDVPSPHDSVDKLLLANTEQQLFGTALDLVGGHRVAAGDNQTDEIVKGYLYGRSASVYGGSAQIQRTLIAERLLGLPRSR